MLTETKEAFCARIEPLVKKQARLNLKSAASIELVDIEQEIYLKLLSEWDRVKGRADEELSYLAYQAAATYCQKERSSFMYFSGAFTYSGEMVEKLLAEHVWAQEGDQYDIEGRLDVIAAIDKLTEKRRHAITKRYCHGGALTDNERKAAEAGLRAITDSLNSGKAHARVDIESASEEI